MSIHERAREEWLQAVLGEAPEGADEGYRRHFAECEACRDYARTMEGVLGRLPEALEPVQPPLRLRERVLQAITAEGAAHVVQGADADRTTAPSAIRAAQHARRRRRWMLPATAALWLVVTLGLAWGVADQGRRLADQEAALHALADQYERDVRWLRTAEHILLGARPPDLWATLEPVAPQLAPEATGKAVIYRAYAEVDYLLLAFDGGTAGAPFEVVWVGPDGPVLLGTGMTDEEGGATYVERLPGVELVGDVEVRADPGVLFRGTLNRYAAPQ